MSTFLKRPDTAELEKKVEQVRALAQSAVRWGAARVLESIDQRYGIGPRVITLLPTSTNAEAKSDLSANLAQLSLAVIGEAFEKLLSLAFQNSFQPPEESFAIESFQLIQLDRNRDAASGTRSALRTAKLVVKWPADDRDELRKSAMQFGGLQTIEIPAFVLDSNGLIVYRIECRIRIHCIPSLKGEMK